METDLETFLDGGKLEIAKYGCTGEEVRLARPGTKYCEQQDDRDTVVSRAKQTIKTNPSYHIFGGDPDLDNLFNCETFAYFCSTGKRKTKCDQYRRITDVMAESHKSTT